MTALIGASVFLIVASAIALLFGWITADESLIWMSIVASIAGAVCLSLAYFRARVEADAVARASRTRPRPDPQPQREMQPEPAAVTEASPAVTEASPAVTEASPAVTEASPAAAPGGMDEVVGVRTSKRFHRPACRYAAAKSAQTMTKVDALTAGYAPCGVCKP